MKKINLISLGVYVLVSSSQLLAAPLCKNLLDSIPARLIVPDGFSLAAGSARESAGMRMSQNKLFRNQLKKAVSDFKNFEPVVRSQMSEDLVGHNLFMHLEHMPAEAKGKMIELFQYADSIVREYIVEKIVIDIYSLKTHEEIRKEILEVSPQQLQEDAYFKNKTNATQVRPTLAQNEIVEAAAIRFIDRLQNNIEDVDVRYAFDILSKFPNADIKIDQAMKRVLDGRSTKMALMEPENDATYGYLELVILERKFKGLNSLPLEIENSLQFLSGLSQEGKFLNKILKLHTQYDLRNSPDLAKALASYFKNNPNTFMLMKNLKNADLLKFEKDYPF